MSGGAYEYAYFKVQEFAEMLEHGETTDSDKIDHPEAAMALRKKFAVHLKLVAEAMKAIEWTDSGDSSVEDEAAAILVVLGAN